MKLNDRPVKERGDDDLNRLNFAEMVANEIRLFDSSEGCVVAVTGPWGSGKSSVIHLMEPYLKDEGKGHVVWFNPWFFSSTDDLVGRFFQQISIALGLDPRFQSIAEGAANLGTALTPINELSILAGPVGILPSVFKVPKKLIEVWQGGIEKQKSKLSEELKHAETNFYFVMDDIDRLTSQEIRDVGKLVRLTGNLPRVTYILAYDRQRVEQALDEDGLSGQEYLEKIVFASFDVPQIHSSHVGHVLESGLNDLFARVNVTGEIDSHRVYQVVNEVCLNRIANLRNAKRFVASCGPALSQLAQDVDVLDLLCLEVVRIFEPDLFKVILANYRFLSWSEDDGLLFTPDRDQSAKDAVESVMNINDDHAIKWILKNLFPIGWQKFDDRFSPPQNYAQMSRDRRVGHQDFMTLYAARFEDRGIKARRRAEQLVQLKAAVENYNKFFSSFELDEVADIADILTEMTRAFTDVAVVVPLSISLLAQARKEGARRRRFLDTGVAQPAANIMARLLEKSSPENRTKFVDLIYGLVPSFESKYQVLKVAQSTDSNGSPLLDAKQVEQLNQQFASDFKAAEPGRLSQERWLFFLATEVMESTSASPADLPDFLVTPEVAWAFLRSSVQPSLNSRSGEQLHAIDVVKVDQVLGGRQRTLELINICKDHPSGKDDDAEYTLATDRAIIRLNHAVMGGDPSS